MHDPEFEKKVQQKMEELAFSPSEAVWTNLERRISTKKRRRLPLFWLFFLSGLLLAGGVGAYLILSPRASVPGSGVAATTSPAGNGSPAPIPSPGSTVSITPRSSATVSSPGADASVPAGNTASSLTPTSPGNAPSSPVTTASGNVPPSQDPSSSGSTISSLSSIASNISHKRNASRGRVPHPSAARTSSPRGLSHRLVSDPTSGTEDIARQDDDQQASPRWSATGGIVPLGPDGSRDPASALFTVRPPYGKLTARSLPVPASGAAKKTATPLKPSVWAAGFAGGAGLSSASQDLFPQTANRSFSSVPASSLTRSPSLAAPARAQGYHNQQGFSFWAGVFAQRPVLKKLSLSIGLNLHYYSTITETGQQVSAPVPGSVVTSSLFYSTAVIPAAQSYPYYPAGNGYTFTNRYYFLEIPVSLQWQLNRGKKLPLFWEGGLSLSRLMSENALYYNGSAGLYYKDGGGVANPIQFSASTSFMIGLAAGSSRIQVGPQIQYGLTSLVNEKIAGAQHLLYGGLKFTIIPGRK